MKQQNKRALLIFGIFYVSFGIMLAVFQERVVYHPNTQDFTSCVEFQDAEKVEYRGTRMYVKDTDKPTVVLYHGNAGSACDRYFYAELFSQAGYGYIVLEYAGFSIDTRTPSHALVKQDIHNLLGYVDEVGISSIFVVGESIGTGIASYHASIEPPEKLLLISPFTSLADVAKNRFWFYPTSVLVDNAFDTVANLKQYRNPITIIHGSNDTIIPHELGKELFESLTTEKQFITIEGAGHNDLLAYPETYTALKGFLMQP